MCTGGYQLRTNPFDCCVDMIVGREDSVASCISSGKTLSCRLLCALLSALLKTLLNSVVTTVIGTCHLGLYPLSGCV